MKALVTKSTDSRGRLSLQEGVKNPSVDRESAKYLNKLVKMFGKAIDKSQGGVRISQLGREDEEKGAEVDENERLSVASLEKSTDETQINLQDVQELRSISRKSINDFTSEDIQKTEKWARKFHKELGIKSPFFRAWFGDWRAADKKSTKILEAALIEGKNPRGTFINKDTGWEIVSSSVGYDETISHSGKDKLSVLAMRNIDKIIENGVLFDTEISEYGRGKKSIHTAFMHKFYSLIKIKEQFCIVKLAVEESYMPGQNKTHKKFYHVRAIKIEPVSTVEIGKSHTSIMENTDSTISISDLFEIVKQYDEDFHPKTVNQALLNEDGTPRVVYHGSNKEFSVFDLQMSGKNFGETSQGFFFFTNKKSAYPNSASDYANEISKKGGTPKVYECYLSIKKPLRLDSKGYYDTTSYFDSNYNEIYKQYLEGDYDGVIIENSDKSADDGVLYLVDDSTQVKSATDNIGTFDKDNPYIRYSKPKSSKDDIVFEEAENGSVRVSVPNPAFEKMQQRKDAEQARKENFKSLLDETGTLETETRYENDNATDEERFEQAEKQRKEAEDEYTSRKGGYTGKGKVRQLIREAIDGSGVLESVGDDVAFLTKDAQRSIISTVFSKVNSANGYDKKGFSSYIAQKIMQNIVLGDSNVYKAETVLKSVMHKLDLSSIEERIDKREKLKITSRWKLREGNTAIPIKDAALKLNELGFNILAIDEFDALNEINRVYENIKKYIDEEQGQRLVERMGKEEYEEARKKLADDIFQILEENQTDDELASFSIYN